MVASFAGHWLEILVQLVIRWFGGEGASFGIGAKPFEPYPVYGLAVFGMVMMWQAVPGRLKKNVPMVFVLLTGVCALAEYLVGWLSIWRYGQNPFWNYAGKPFNLHGLICLQNALLFGVAATAFMLLVFPWTEKLLDKLPRRVLFGVAAALWLVFWVCQIWFGH